VLQTLAGLLAEAGVRGKVSGGEVSNGKIAFSRRNADGYPDIYVIDERGANESRLTNDGRYEEGPTWSPEERR
jgi:WD40-like Beta Propeller Repeat